MDILYHYCSTASFHAIVQSHALWLSSLSLSNDTMKGKLVASAIACLAEKDSLDEAHIRRLQDGIRFIEEIVDGLGFCLSEDGDLLSQWRGYAGDATGVAIGFSSEHLDCLSKVSLSRHKPGFTLEKVEYELSAQEARVKPTYSVVKQFITDGAFNTPGRGGRRVNSFLSPDKLGQEEVAIQQPRSKLDEALISIFPQLFRLKAHAFREECEWRLLSYLVENENGHCSHRVVDNRIVPYREFGFAELAPSPIAKVILGPKHGTPPKIVEAFLRHNNYGTVKVHRSEASYR
jgi:hypothetical protein